MDAGAQNTVEDRTSDKAQLGKVDKANPSDTLKSGLDKHNSTGDTKFSQNTSNNNISDEAKKLAAAALSAVKDAAAAALNRGKIEITEVRDFAGQEIEIRKRIEADSREAVEKAKTPAPSAVDALLDKSRRSQSSACLKDKKRLGRIQRRQ